MKIEIQKALKYIGDEGCYFLCLRKLANRADDTLLEDYYTCLEHDYMDKDCYIKDPVAILRSWGVKWTNVRKSNSYGQIVVYKHNAFLHFCALTEDGLFDPLGESNTVKNGHVDSYRLFW